MRLNCSEKGRLLCLDLKENLAAQITDFKYSEEIEFSGAISGYAGIASPCQTLNSQFYYLLFNKSSDHDVHLFPQRVPRLGFFEEIQAISPREISDAIFNIRNLYSQFTNKLVRFNHNELEPSFEYSQILKVALRLGVSVNFDNYDFLSSLPFQIRKIYIDIIINQCVSANNEVPFDIIEREILNTSGVEKIDMINRYIVCAARYNRTIFSQKSEFVREVTRVAIDLLSTAVVDTNSDKVFFATIFRGLPMSAFFPAGLAGEYLTNAESLLNSIAPANLLEAIAKQENLFTLLLTKAKFALNVEKDSNKFIECLSEMIKLDPNDSTPYSELALYFFKSNDVEKSIGYFDKASMLGPPSVSLNYYFKGEALKSLERVEAAIVCYQKSIAYDAQALSPWLGLFEIYRIRGLSEASVVAKKILNSDDLNDQLTKDEICLLRSYI